MPAAAISTQGQFKDSGIVQLRQKTSFRFLVLDIGHITLSLRPRMEYLFLHIPPRYG
jgi:hypothetical protein